MGYYDERGVKGCAGIHDLAICVLIIVYREATWHEALHPLLLIATSKDIIDNVYHREPRFLSFPPSVHSTRLFLLYEHATNTGSDSSCSTLKARPTDGSDETAPRFPRLKHGVEGPNAQILGLWLLSGMTRCLSPCCSFAYARRTPAFWLDLLWLCALSQSEKMSVKTQVAGSWGCGCSWGRQERMSYSISYARCDPDFGWTAVVFVLCVTMVSAPRQLIVG